jgi:hypothetical protein
MEFVLNAKEEIKKEEKRKLPTITIAIVSHGEDLIYEKLDKIDPNVRIYSRAGQPLCLNVGSRNDEKITNDLYFSDERLSGEDKRSSYEMLQELSKKYKIPEYDERFLQVISKDIENNSYPRSVKHTIKTIEKQKHSQIYTPSYDHRYIFTDKKNANMIAVFETINHTSKSNIDYQELPNLAKLRYNIRYFSELAFRNQLEERRILEFLEKFHLTPMPESELDESQKKNFAKAKQIYARNKNQFDEPIFYLTRQKLLQCSKNIYENRRLIFQDGFVSEDKLLLELENPDSKIYDYITYPEDKEIIEKTMNEIKILESDDEKLRSQKIKKRSIFYNEYDNNKIESILLSDVITFLKTEGFEVINIIDFSCRSFEKKVEKDIIAKLEKDQLQNAMLIDQGLGKKQTRKTKRRQRRKLTQRRKHA